MIKKLKIGTLVVFGLLTSCSSSTENNTSIVEKNFEVIGNCNMCKATIEEAVQNQDGIETATWNKESKQMTVKFDTNAISFEEINQRIANSGYGTDLCKANEEAYQKLPKCCHYKD